MAIRVLPRQLVNKIAAGEVIERPASIVKELVENAIDAGAGRIDVAIEDGGKKLIAVSDDGCGMSADDLALAFAPHATSKLRGEDDLFAIRTMGFRGEALASVASVSHAHIRTRRADEDGGHELSAAGEVIDSVRPCAAAPGTTVTIRDLFFNTPARRKFLRTANTEMGHVTEHLTRLALPHRQVAFTLSHNGRETLNLPPTDTTRRRVADLFGGDLAECLLRLSVRRGKVRVEGLIAPPSAARGSGRWQYFFINGRYVRDRLLAHALREAYRGLIDPSRYPVAFVFLGVDPGEVDVNVHPTKIEVRFHESQLVHGELLASLKETLNKANLTPGASLAGAEFAAEPPAGDEAAAQRRQSLREALADFFKSTPPVQPRFSFSERGRTSAPGGRQATVESSSPLVETRDAYEPVPPRPSAETPRRVPAGVETPRMQAVQIHNSYIVAACEDGLVIVDQHALHERLIYNDLRGRLADAGSPTLSGQRLLIPETLKVTAAEAATLERCAELLRRLGIEVASFGPATVAVQQFPTLLAERGVSAGEFLREMLDALGEDETTDPERMLEEVLEMMACKAAVKAGDPLTPAEIDSLLARREAAERGSACPHGRPTTLKLTLKDLDRQFKRT